MSKKSVEVATSALMIVVLGALVTPTATAEDATEASASARKPNIVLIMADDMGWSDAGCYGGDVSVRAPADAFVMHPRCHDQ